MTFVGSIILLLTSPTKSVVSLFLLTVAITLTVLGKRANLKISIRGGTKLHILLLLACIALMILQLESIYIELINVILYVIVFVFALGFFLLNILKFKPSFSCLEFVSLAYPLSIVLIAIFGTVASILPSNLTGLSLSSLAILLSILSIYRMKKEKQTKLEQKSELTIGNHNLVLLLILLIFAFFLITLYPQISNILGLDIARNFLHALGSTKNLPSNFYYPNTGEPLFTIYQSSMIYIVHPSNDLFQTVSVFLNLLGILTFYTMAKQYLKQYGKYVPTLATLIWALFAGMGWLSFLSLKISNPSASTIWLISEADVLSYGDITWRRLFQSLSMETSLFIVFAILYFFKRNDLSRTQLILFMTILVTPLPLMHPYAISFLAPALLCLAIFNRVELRTQAKYTAISLAIGAFASLLLNHVLQIKIPTISITYIPFLAYLLTSLALMGMSLGQNATPNILKVTVSKILNSKYTFLVVVVVLLLYFASLLLWISGTLPFNMTSLDLFGYVPLFLYPAKLGVAGILALIAIILFLRNPTYRSRELGAMIALILLLSFGSMILAAIQMQYVSTFTFDLNSWLSETIRQNILSFREERMFEIFKIPLAIVGSVALGKFAVTKAKRKRMVASNYIVAGGLILLMLISGMASTFLGFEYFQNDIQTNPLSSSELNIIEKMQNSVYANGKATIISPQTPTGYLDFTGAAAIVTESTAAWMSECPELPLFVTRYAEATPTFIYLNKIRDYSELNDYAGNYLAHLSNVTSTYLENSEVQIKEINDTSIPTPNSSTALIIPYDASTMSVTDPFYQQEESQYTIASLFFQQSLQSMNSYQEPINYTNVQIHETAIFNGINSFIRINGSQTNPDRISVQFEFQPLDLTRVQIIVCKFDCGIPPKKSWEIAQYDKAIVFKLSSDGENEEVLTTGDILQLGSEYIVRCEYDGASMKIFVNNQILATTSYQKEIFKSDADLAIGAQLYNNSPTTYAKMLLKYIRILNDIPPISTPVFCAYDLLSLTGLNYTTVVSGDNALGAYETLILPYDDITTQEMLTNIESLQQSNIRYIVIINANGYGPLLSIFGNRTSKTFTADKILTDQESAMQPSLEVPKINLNNDTKTMAQYVNSNASSPMVMTITQSQRTLIYVNIYPLLSQNQLFNPTPLQALTKTLGHYVGDYDSTTVTPWFTEPSLLFTKLNANGTVSIRSNSIASIELPENQTLNTNGYNAIVVDSTRITIQRGYGFYATLIAYNPSITLQGNQITSLTINGNATFLLRQPKISISGTIQFEDFYMLHPPIIYTDGRTTTLSGNITLNICVSDEYTIALPYKFNSPITVRYEKPLMEFNENTSFMLMVPYIILIMIFATMILLIQHSKHDEYAGNQERNPQNANLKKA